MIINDDDILFIEKTKNWNGVRVLKGNTFVIYEKWKKNDFFLLKVVFLSINQIVKVQVSNDEKNIV